MGEESGVSPAEGMVHREQLGCGCGCGDGCGEGWGQKEETYQADLVLNWNQICGYPRLSHPCTEVFPTQDAGCGFVLLYCTEIYSLQSYSVQDFYHEEMLNFVKDFFCIY